MSLHCNPFLEQWENIFRRHPDSPAVFDDEGRCLRTFAGIEDRANQWALHLRGFRKVLLRAANGPEWPEALLGIWKSGAVAIPCDSEIPEIENVCALCGIDAVIEDSNDGLARRAVGGTNAAGSEIPDGIHLLKVTSGTSSERRAIAFSGGQLLADARNICATMGIGCRDRNLGLIGFAHSYGLSNLIGTLFSAGVPLVIARDALPHAVLSAIRHAGATVFPGVPAIFRSLLSLPELPLRLCISAGAPLSPTDAMPFHSRFGLKIHSFYGASECGGICYDADEDPDRPAGYVGQALQGVTLRERPAAEGLQLEVNSAAVGHAYIPPRPGDTLQDGRFTPGDLLESCREGFRIVGREADFINVAGKKVMPSTIEAGLLRCPGVQEALVLGLPDHSARGETIAACIVGEITEETLRAECPQFLPTWQIPRRWVFLDALPVNERGKLSRTELRKNIFRGS